MIRTVVVEDELVLANALQIALDVQADLSCIGAVGTVEDALRLVTTHNPDVVLMDIHLPGVDGIEGTRRIVAACPNARVLILTGDDSPEHLAAAAAAGAVGFLGKYSAFPDVLAAIRAAVSGKILVEATALTALLDSHRSDRSRAERARNNARLTARELDVLSLMGDGLDPTSIAERLVVSTHTARGHVKNIMKKLGAHSQLEAVVMALRDGMLPRPDTRL